MLEASIQGPPGFSSLSKAEQIRYLQALWDLISETPGDVPVPKSHLELVEKRLQRYREDPSTASSAFDMLDSLVNKSR